MSAAIAIAAVSSSAVAAPIVPPGNSAATQYTEAFPTAGGPKETGKPKHGKGTSPGKVLGTQNTKRLHAHGADGHAAAEVAAATAPSTIVTPTPETGAATQREAAGQAGSDTSTGTGSSTPPGESVDRSGAQAAEPGGSSGFDQVMTQITGSSSSGGTGLLLPLAIVVTIALSLVYLARQRKRPAP